MHIYRSTSHLSIAFIFLVFSSICFANNVDNSATTISSHQSPYFEVNKGQFDSKTQFAARLHKLFYGFKQNGFYVTDEINRKIVVQFENSLNSDLKGQEARVAKLNYKRGTNPNKFIDGVDTYKSISTKNIYPGIDITYYFNNDGRMEYDFIVSPGASPETISLAFNQIDGININNDGHLEIQLGDQKLLQHAPFAYQLDEKNNKIPVAASYVLSEGKIKFEVANFDTSKSLVIDPIIEFSGLLGGEWEDQVNAMAKDSEGNFYLVGSTAARARITYKNIITLENTAMPVHQDLLHNHYYDNVHGISLDSSFKSDYAIDITNERVLNSMGQVVQEEYPYECEYEYQGFFKNDRMITDYDGFISKYNSNFELVYTTYFGGCRNDGIRAIAIDASDNVYIAGLTLSSDFPVRSAYQSTLAPSRLANDPVQADAFYAKLNKNGELLYSSYLGGNGRDGIRDITVDENESLYLLGYTHSTDLKTNCIVGKIPVLECDSIGGVKSVEDVGNTQDVVVYSDVFVAKVAKTGDVISFMTYFGGKYDDWGQAIKLFNNEIYIAGNTSSPDITSNGDGYSFASYRQNSEKCSRSPIYDDITVSNSDLHLCEDAFVAKISADGTSLGFSTYIGGGRDDNVSDMEIDSSGNIYLVGSSRSRGGFFDLDNQQKFSTPEELKAYNDVFLDSFLLYKNANEYKINPDIQTDNAFFVVLNNDASQLITSSFIGGDNEDSGLKLAIREKNDGSNLVDVFIAGQTLSPNFYTLKSFNSLPSKNDVFLLKLVLDMNKSEVKYDLPIEPYLSDSTSCYASSKDGCGLYSIIYSSIFGGEGLDDLKDILVSGDSIYLTGTTFSKHFPYVGEKLRSQINEIDNIEYEPETRKIVDQVKVIPSEGYVVKLKDIEQNIDLSLGVTVANKAVIREGDDVELKISIKNKSAIYDAKSVRLIVNYPYITSLENIESFVSISLPATNCALHLTQLFCLVGIVEVQGSRAITMTIKTNDSGNMPLSFALSTIVTDDIESDNIANLTVDVKAISKGGSLSLFFLLMLSLFVFVALIHRNLKHFRLWT